ncbi:DUF885 domain-containing protein [Saccharopolyspora flava]|nr:DUF885 domain-containing protein [Saccharopolyspora flava]
MTRDVADDILDVLIEENPLDELLQGLPGTAGRLPDPREDAESDLRARASRIAAEARDGDDLTSEVVIAVAEGVATRVESRLVEHTMHDSAVSPLSRVLEMVPEQRPQTPEQERDFLRLLAAIPDFLARSGQRHLDGARAGRLPVARRVRVAIEHVDAHLSAPQRDPLRKPPLTSEDERNRLLEERIRPAFAAYREVLRDLPGRSDDEPGLCFLPDGERTYASLVRMHTTTERTPEELHRTGLELLAELDEEYAEIGSRVFGLRDVADIRHRMRTDPALYWSSGQELLDAARTAVSRAEEVAPQWFGRTPAQRCRVSPFPEDQAPDAVGGAYLPGPIDGSRPGTYFANTHAAEQRPRFLAEPLAFHEAVPGHHFQISLAQQLTDVPMIRKVAGFNAYIEGWGLYAERLADEIGLYSDDLSRLGMLAMDSARAARLVVDTGLHAFGWTRQQVVDFLRARTPTAEVEVQSETDRYIESPGQALSYMVGRLEFQRLRAQAGVDLRAFHDGVLATGPLPLSALAREVASWSRRG